MKLLIQSNTSIAQPLKFGMDIDFTPELIAYMTTYPFSDCCGAAGIESLALGKSLVDHWPLTRYVKLWVGPLMLGMFSPPPVSKETASYRSRHASRHVRHARAVMHIGVANPRWRGKRPRHSRRMRNLQFYVIGKRPMELCFSFWCWSCHFVWCNWVYQISIISFLQPDQPR